MIQPTIKTKKRYIALTTYRRLRYNIRHIKGKKNKKRAVGRQERGRRRIVELDHLRRRSADSRWEKKHLASSTTLNASLVLFSFQICMCCCCFHVIKSIGKREREREDCVTLQMMDIFPSRCFAAYSIYTARWLLTGSRYVYSDESSDRQNEMLSI